MGSGSASILLFPWLAYGHVVPFVGLAKQLSDRGYKVHICSTAINLKSIEKMIVGTHSHSIHLVEHRLPEADFPELPQHYHTANGLPTTLYETLHRAVRLSKPHFAKILRGLRPNLVICDYVNVLWAQTIAGDLSIPSVRFYISSVASLSFFSHLATNGATVAYPFPAITLSPRELSVLAGISGDVRANEHDPDVDWQAPQKLVLVSSSNTIEAKFIEHFERMKKCKVVPVPVASIVEVPETAVKDDDDVLDWLGHKNVGSTVFISFGSEYFPSKEEIEEIGCGLELSNANFIWVLRFRKDADLTAQKVLPPGFLDRVKNKGRVIEGWAPQAKILNHPSIGAFVSQCGWNSVLESINFGVPIIALPGHLEQPVNARFLVDLGVAVEIKRDDDGKLWREKIASVIAAAIGGENLRENMKKMSEDLKLKRDEEIQTTILELDNYMHA